MSDPLQLVVLTVVEELPSGDVLAWPFAEPDKVAHGRSREEALEKVRLALADDNIESRPLWKPMHLQPLYEHYPAYTNGVSEKLFEYGLCLPSGSSMTEKDRERVVSVIKHVMSEAKYAVLTG